MKVNIVCKFVFGLYFLVFSIQCDAQIVELHPKYVGKYKGVTEIVTYVKLGTFGCDYERVKKVGKNHMIEESSIKIPNLGVLNIKNSYHYKGDILVQKYSFDNRSLIIENSYKYYRVRLEDGTYKYGKLIEQTSTIGNSDPVTIRLNSMGLTPRKINNSDDNSNSLNKQLKKLKKAEDQAILNLLGEIPRSEMYDLSTCNCKNTFQSELTDQIYDYKLFRLHEKSGVSLGPGRRNGVLYFRSNPENGKLNNITFSYNQTHYLVESYKYKYKRFFNK